MILYGVDSVFVVFIIFDHFGIFFFGIIFPLFSHEVTPPLIFVSIGTAVSIFGRYSTGLEKVK